MSLFSIAVLPMQTMLPAAETLAGTAATFVRPVVGLSAMLAFVMVFRPLLTGLLRAAVLVVKPRPSLEERAARRRSQRTRIFLRMADRFDTNQPNQAAEFRNMASHD